MRAASDLVVLLVQDDSNEVLLFKRAFSLTGSHAVLRVAEDAEQAQSLLMRQDADLPSLILLDLTLPGRSGMELLGWIRSRKPLRSVVVAAFTSSREPNDMRLAYEMGVNSFLVKPIGFDALLATVRLLCDYWLGLNERPEPRAAERFFANRERR